jgi:hypothetical protein
MEQSAEEIVGTSDDRAVRMAFDERNLDWSTTSSAFAAARQHDDITIVVATILAC